jgi:hypothetical protein
LVPALWFFITNATGWSIGRLHLQLRQYVSGRWPSCEVSISFGTGIVLDSMLLMAKPAARTAPMATTSRFIHAPS